MFGYNENTDEMIIWEKMDKDYPLQKISEGVYKTELELVLLTKTKQTNVPMVKFKFLILDEKYKNNRIFVNKTIKSEFQFSKIKELIKSFNVKNDIEKISNFKELGIFLKKFLEESEKFIFEINYYENDYGHGVFEVLNTLVREDFEKNEV